MQILWQQVANTILTDPELMGQAELHANSRETKEKFQKLSKFDPLNKHCLLLINLVTIAALLNTKDLLIIAQNYYLFKDLIMIQRSVALDLTLNKNRALISLCTMMLNCEIKTVTLAHKLEKEIEAQQCYLVYVQQMFYH